MFNLFRRPPPADTDAEQAEYPLAGEVHGGADRSDTLDRVREALRQIYDPEIPVNIYDLGLIYGIDVDSQGRVAIRMTLTAPACPVAQTFPGTVAARVEEVPGVTHAHVELVWEPPWSPEHMTDEARLELGWL